MEDFFRSADLQTGIFALTVNGLYSLRRSVQSRGSELQLRHKGIALDAL